MIGLIGGLGVGAAIHYYRGLASAHEEAKRPLELSMAHASIARATALATAGDRAGLAEYLAGFLARLKTIGATIGVVPAVTPHMCKDELKAISPLPLIDITVVVSDHIRQRQLSRVALFGTRFVMESDLYGALDGVEVVHAKDAERDFVHDAYTRLAHTGIVDASERDQLVALAHTLQRRDGVQAVVLAGTDFAVMFDASNTPFPHVDCARAHIDAIVRAGQAN
jgi:aspartate racemase